MGTTTVSLIITCNGCCTIAVFELLLNYSKFHPQSIRCLQFCERTNISLLTKAVDNQGNKSCNIVSVLSTVLQKVIFKAI